MSRKELRLQVSRTAERAGSRKSPQHHWPCTLSCDQLPGHHKLGPFSSPPLGWPIDLQKNEQLSRSPRHMQPWRETSTDRTSHKSTSEMVIFLQNKLDLCLQIFPSYLLKYKKSFIRNVSSLWKKMKSCWHVDRKVAECITREWFLMQPHSSHEGNLNQSIKLVV